MDFLLVFDQSNLKLKSRSLKTAFSIKAIADSGSLVGAAEALALNHSTVFRRLGALEEKLTKILQKLQK